MQRFFAQRFMKNDSINAYIISQRTLTATIAEVTSVYYFLLWKSNGTRTFCEQWHSHAKSDLISGVIFVITRYAPRPGFFKFVFSLIMMTFIYKVNFKTSPNRMTILYQSSL